jgi:DNA-binding NarL/FixJ family response regulator
MSPVTTIALVDDHRLLRNGLAELINGFPGYRVHFEAGNGRELIEKLKTPPPPDVVLLDINMPEMDGFATAEWLRANYPAVKVLALSMDDQETAIIRMLRAGASGYVLKDSETSEFRVALDTLTTKGFYYSDYVANTLMHSLQMPQTGPAAVPEPTILLNAREKEFLSLVCTELTYKEIADKMCLSTRTIDGYREELFNKLGVRSRTMLVLFAIKRGLVNLDD